jgi:tRNA dimethylallyltransferase
VQPNPILLLAGPTASGKSALALRLAEQTGGEIVNADALQLYADLRILSARPSPDEEARSPHHLFGLADAADGWSVGRWLRAATNVLADIAARGRPAIVVGGTGLYFKALTVGLAAIPPVPAQATADAEARFDTEGETAARAVARATGRALSDWQADTKPALTPDAWRAVVLEPPRQALYARCDARLIAMIETGAIEEAAALMARGLDPRLPALKAVALRELAACAAGELTREAALKAAQLATRHYAKRQMTWFRNQTPDWPSIVEADAEGQWAALSAMSWY